MNQVGLFYINYLYFVSVVKMRYVENIFKTKIANG